MNFSQYTQKVALTDFGSAERIFELLHGIPLIEFICNREEVAESVPKSWRRRDHLDVRPKEELIIGSGSDTEFVDDQIENCLQARGFSTVVLDSWVNYEERFSVKPNRLLVTDPWARDLAFSYWPHIDIKLKLIDRSHLRIEHSGRVKKIIIIGVPKNDYTVTTLTRHKVDGSCVCPEFDLLTQAFKDVDIIFKPHPNSTDTCQKTSKYLRRAEYQHTLNMLVDNETIVVGRPSYAHYFLESIGIPAFFSENTNQLWKGPKFRALTSIL